ncbi:MAG: serine/threonine protein kinase [Myxococcales bacterium]|nr:serine/threonine protein kinase [Myxococcales bacterium]
MAEVYFGQVEGVDGFLLPVAIKRVREAHVADPDFMTAFSAEAKLAARLSHPNIVRVLDFQMDAKGIPFMVMEYVHGKDLSALWRTGALPCSTAVHVAGEVLRGLSYAHDLPTSAGLRGVVHRDVSPQNILLSWHGEVKVTDFGIAKAFSTSVLAHSMTIKGKPGYMSPEQINTEPLDGRSDLFSVGIVLWELLTGKPLFEATTYRETLARVLYRQVPRPSEEAQAPIPAEVEAVVLRLLERDKDQRYATAHEAMSDLLACEAAPRNGMRELADLLAHRCQRPKNFTPMMGLAVTPPGDALGESSPQAVALTARGVSGLASEESRRTRTMDVPTTGPRQDPHARRAVPCGADGACSGRDGACCTIGDSRGGRPAVAGLDATRPHRAASAGQRPAGARAKAAGALGGPGGGALGRRCRRDGAVEVGGRRQASGRGAGGSGEQAGNGPLADCAKLAGGCDPTGGHWAPHRAGGRSARHAGVQQAHSGGAARDVSRPRQPAAGRSPSAPQARRQARAGAAADSEPHRSGAHRGREGRRLLVPVA